MSQEKITLTLDSEKKAALNELATIMERDLSDVLNEAIATYLEMNQWLRMEIEKGIAEAEAGDFATEKEVQAIFAKLTNAN